MTLFEIEIEDKPIKDSSFNQCFWQIKNDGGIMSQLVDVLTNSSDWTSSRCTMEWKAEYVKMKRYVFILQINRNGEELSDNDSLLPTPTLVDATNNGDMTYAAKILKGATHRSSGQPIQKTLTMKIHENILKNNEELAEELSNRVMFKRLNLPSQKEFVNWLRNITNAKELSKLIDVKLSTVEHWFRYDSSGFSFPTIDEWNKIIQFFEVSEDMNYKMTHKTSIEWQSTIASEKIKTNGLLPTPATRDANNAEYPTQYQKRKEYQKKKGVNLEYPLRQFVMDINPNGKTSQLNPNFVLEMMGFPADYTQKPFIDDTI